MQYLETGLVEAPSINRDLKLLIHATSEEFYDFAHDNIALDVEYNKKELHRNFMRQFPDFNVLKQRKFTSWLKWYAEAKHLKIVERKSGDDYFVKFINS